MMENLDLHPHLIRQVLKLSFVLICNNSITSFENGSLYSKQRIYSRYPGWIFMHFWNFSVCILMIIYRQVLLLAGSHRLTQGVYCTGSVQFTVLYCVIMNEVVRRETPNTEGIRGIALQLYWRGSVTLCFKAQTVICINFEDVCYLCGRCPKWHSYIFLRESRHRYHDV